MGIKMLRLSSQGKNLFDIDSLLIGGGGGLTLTKKDNKTLHLEGTATGYGTWNIEYPEPIIRAGETAVFKWTTVGDAPSGGFYGFRVRHRSPDSNTQVNNGVAFTATFDIDRLQLYTSNTGTYSFDITDIQLEKGSAATAYEPYHEYLYKSGVQIPSRYQPATSADTTKHPQTLTGYAVMSLNVNWTRTTSYTYPMFYISKPSGIALDGGKSFCNFFENIGGCFGASSFSGICTADNQFAYNNSSNRQLYVRCDTITNAADFQSYCAENDVKCLYELATSDGLVWDFVKDTETNSFGYLRRNDPLMTFCKVYGATGIQSSTVVYDQFFLKGGNT